jgi:hypothetical protein
MVPLNHDDWILKARFEDASLPPTDFDHRTHLRVAWAYLVENADFALAAWRFRSALRRYADAVGAESKVHETITWGYLALMREAMDGRDDRDAASLLAAHPGLLDHRTGALAAVFDVPAVTADPVARRLFVLPRAYSDLTSREGARAGSPPSPRARRPGTRSTPGS